MKKLFALMTVLAFALTFSFADIRPGSLYLSKIIESVLA